MTTFRFALAGLLRLRSHELEVKRREHSHEAEALRGAEANAKTGRERAREAEERAGRVLARGVEAPHAHALHVDSLARFAEAARAAEGAQASAVRVDESREQLREAWRRVRMLEALHRRALERHRAELARREQRDLDEAGQAVRRAAS